MALRTKEMRRRSGGWFASLSLALILAGMAQPCAAGADDAVATDAVDYVKQIKPLLKERCYACHGALKQEAALRVDTGLAIRAGGDGGEAAIPRDPEGSLLLERVSAALSAGRMPPEGEPLTPAQIDSIRRWIAAGATTPADETPEADPRAHWAFQRPLRAPLPSAGTSAGPAHPVDAFVDESLRAKGLTPRPPASKETLLRRVTLDLIGLPPTRAELHAFLNDQSPEAYERVVDRLLADPRYGERWARHWMDVWRYSDWYGRRDINDVRNSAGQIYRWRDWIVRSLNADKGYDRMVQEMLAADELFPEDYDAGVATGFVIRNYYSLNANDWMRSVVEHTGKAFLGLTFNCAHCHDHKYDPIANDDYFKLRAFFEPLAIRQDRVPGEADPGPFEEYVYGGSRKVQRLGAVRLYDKTLDAPTWFYEKGDERNRVAARGSIPPGVPAFLGTTAVPKEPVGLPPQAWYPGLRPEIQQVLLDDAARAVATAEAELATVRALPSMIPQELTDELTRAEAEFATAKQAAIAAGTPGALVGEQSLILDATTGRRILLQALKGLPEFSAGLRIEFELLLLADAHFNVQLIQDLGAGTTATAVVFEKGRIAAYQPGTTNEFEAGRYDPAAGPLRFAVTIELEPANDRGLLTVKWTGREQPLVDAVPIALNKWNPVGNDKQPLALDARPGSVAVVDTLQFLTRTGPDAAWAPQLRFDFEAPAFSDGRDVIGLEGWSLGTAFSQPPATSLVSSTAANLKLRELALVLETKRRPAKLPSLRLQAAEAKLTAARAVQAGLQARIETDRVRYSSEPPADLSERIRQAGKLEREGALQRAEAELLAGERAVLEAEQRPTADAERVKVIEAAGKTVAAANVALSAARLARSDPKLADQYTPLTQQFPQKTSGRRQALALWMTARDNPLTARVAVNHVWSHHFHSPFVSSMTDFGRNGAKPTHPALLDWLAVELMESNWSLKRLHRLMVTSAAYQRVSSVGDARANAERDPENVLLWRMNSGRMEAEVIRDSILFLSGRLDLTQGGVELDNKEILTTTRRSLYYSSHPEGGGKGVWGQLFDAPDPLDCYRRTASIVPQQSLALTNSDFVQQAAVALVAAWKDVPSSSTGTPVGNDPSASDERFAVTLFEQILSRSPTAEELQLALEILREQRLLSESPESPAATVQARESLARILLNHNDFVSIR